MIYRVYAETSRLANSQTFFYIFFFAFLPPFRTNEDRFTLYIIFFAFELNVAAARPLINGFRSDPPYT